VKNSENRRAHGEIMGNIYSGTFQLNGALMVPPCITAYNAARIYFILI